jgi:hypothetical protein
MKTLLCLASLASLIVNACTSGGNQTLDQVDGALKSNYAIGKNSFQIVKISFQSKYLESITLCNTGGHLDGSFIFTYSTTEKDGHQRVHNVDCGLHKREIDSFLALHDLSVAQLSSIAEALNAVNCVSLEKSTERFFRSDRDVQTLMLRYRETAFDDARVDYVIYDTVIDSVGALATRYIKTNSQIIDASVLWHIW